MYNLTGFTNNQTNILSFAKDVNTELMNGWLGIIILVGITVVLMMSFYFSTREIKTSILATCFISFGLSILLRALELIPNRVIFITLIATGLSIAFSWKNN